MNSSKAAEARRQLERPPIGRASDRQRWRRLHLQRRASAVTGACLATRRDVFIRVKGFDELATFKITNNGVDYCLKVATVGLGVVCTPFATLHHFESISPGPDRARRSDGGIDEELELQRSRWPEALRNDPFYNPHFARSRRSFIYLSAFRR